MTMTAIGACGGKRDCPAPAPCPPAAPTATAPVSADHAAPAPAPMPPPPANEVQTEMRLLATAMETAVRGIGTGDVREVEHALHRVHAAKQATEAAVESGRWRPARNADRLEAFASMDEAFHAHLERLVVASAANDVAATAVALGDAVRACEGCHAMFRAPGAVPAAPATPEAPPVPVHTHEH